MTHIVDRAVSSKLVAVARGANRPDERGRGETGDGEANSPTQKTAKEQNLQKARITKQSTIKICRVKEWVSSVSWRDAH